MQKVSLEDIMEQLRNMEHKFDQDLKVVRKELEKLERQMELQADKLEKLERQMELQDLSFRALVKAAKASQEVEEELEGAYVREGTGFNTKRTKWVRDPLA